MIDSKRTPKEQEQLVRAKRARERARGRDPLVKEDVHALEASLRAALSAVETLKRRLR